MSRTAHSARRIGPPHFGRRHAGHTRARSRYHHGFPGAHQCAPGRQHVPGELPAAVEQRYSRQSLSKPPQLSHKSRPRGASLSTRRLPGIRQVSLTDGTMPLRLSLTILAHPQLPARALRTAGRYGAAVEPSQSPQPAQTTRTVAIKNAALKSAVTALRSQRTLRHAVLVRERSHDHTSCIRTGPDCSRPQLLSGRRCTRLTVTCLRPAESRF